MNDINADNVAKGKKLPSEQWQAAIKELENPKVVELVMDALEKKLGPTVFTRMSPVEAILWLSLGIAFKFLDEQQKAIEAEAGKA